MTIVASFDPDGPAPDPATPDRRREVARSLLIWAINGNEAAAHQWEMVRDAYPLLPAPAALTDPGEHAGWLRLFAEADDAFNWAEQALATRITNLYDRLAPEGRKVADDPADDSGYFVPRAVRHQGKLYVVAYDVGSYEPKTNIIAGYREAMTIDLDG